MGGSDEDWLHGPAHWTEVHFEGESSNDQLAEADVSKLPFRSLDWVPGCGPRCEMIDDIAIEDGFIHGYLHIGTAHDRSGPEAFLFRPLYNPETQLKLWRLMKLSDGKVRGAVRGKKVSREGVLNGGIVLNKGHSPNYVIASTEKGTTLRGALDFTSGKWEWKGPYADELWGRTCDRLAVDNEPLTLIDSCLTGIAVYDKPGSIEPTFVSHEGTNWYGAAYGSRAVWTQLPSDSTESLLWSWTRDEGPRVVSTLPGNACGIQVSHSWIVGAVGGSPEGGGLCDAALFDQQLFRMDHEGHSLQMSPRFSFPILLYFAAATDEYAAIFGSQRTEEGFERYYLLVRLSDWSIRRFYERPGRKVAKRHLALDRDYFYFADYQFWTKEPKDFQLRRYPLAEFDSIGEEFVPWAEDD